MSERPAKRPRTEPAKKRRTDHALVNLWEREVGQLPHRNFRNRFLASEGLVKRFGLHKKLEKHNGCVNTVSFNADGDILISGSDDRQVILWDWETGTVKLSFDSGHLGNIFQAKFMPFSDDRSIVTSASDGQVRCSKILDSGQVEISLLGKHEGQVHKLAVEPGSPFSFYTCGEDAVVKHFDLRTRVATNLFTCKEAKYNLNVYLNAIAVDPRNPGLLAVGGMVDGYARVYDIRSYRSEGWYNFAKPVDHFCPRHLTENGEVGITGLAFSDQSELLASYSDEFIYLFSPDMGIGPDLSSTEEKRMPQVYKGHQNCETVKGVSFFGPKCEYVVSGSDCGQIFMWRKKDGELVRSMKADKNVVNCVVSHPHLPLMCSSGIENDIKIWTPGGTEKLMSPGNMEQASESGNTRRIVFHDADGHAHVFMVNDDFGGEDSDESSDDDDDSSTEEEENGEDEDEDDDDDDDDGLDFD